MTSLLKLDVSTNKLTSVPKSIGALSSLHRLDLSSNQLVRTPNHPAARRKSASL